MPSMPSDSAGPQGLRRRDLLLGTLAAGFAVAVRPIAASTITTAAEGLTAGFVSIPVQGRSIPAYRARPAAGTNLPVVLVVQEIFGVHAYIQDVCRRLARLGYLAIAPSLFERQGDVTKLPDIAAILPVVATVPDAQVMADLDASVAWAASSGGGNISKLGITGFCWGGPHHLALRRPQPEARRRRGLVWPPGGNPHAGAALLSPGCGGQAQGAGAGSVRRQG